LGLPHPPFIPPYSICPSCQCLACLMYSSGLYGHQPIQHCNLACSFIFPFLTFIFSFTRWWERPTRNSCTPLLIHNRQLGNITRRTYDQNPGFSFPKTFKHGFRSFSTSINMTTSCIQCTYKCRKVHLNNVCIGYEHLGDPIQWNHDNPSPFSPIDKSQPPSFC
jgi:hypothetical protein